MCVLYVLQSSTLVLGKFSGGQTLIKKSKTFMCGETEGGSVLANAASARDWRRVIRTTGGMRSQEFDRRSREHGALLAVSARCARTAVAGRLLRPGAGSGASGPWSCAFGARPQHRSRGSSCNSRGASGALRMAAGCAGGGGVPLCGPLRGVAAPGMGDLIAVVKTMGVDMRAPRAPRAHFARESFFVCRMPSCIAREARGFFAAGGPGAANCASPRSTRNAEFARRHRRPRTSRPAQSLCTKETYGLAGGAPHRAGGSTRASLFSGATFWSQGCQNL